MGQDCCANRFKGTINNNQRNGNGLNTYIQSSLSSFKINMSISLLYLVQGKASTQVNLENVIELAQNCDQNNHICCLFQPNFLQNRFGLVELQSPGISFGAISLSEAFWSDLEYFYDQEICSDWKQFSVLLLIEVQNKGKHVLVVQRKEDVSRGNHFILYDCFNRTKAYRERFFQDEEGLNASLNKLGAHFYQVYSPQTLSIKLLSFNNQIEPTVSEIESIQHHSNSLSNQGSSNIQVELTDIAFLDINIEAEHQQIFDPNQANSSKPQKSDSNSFTRKCEPFEESKMGQSDSFVAILPPSLVRIISESQLDQNNSKNGCGPQTTLSQNNLDDFSIELERGHSHFCPTTVTFVSEIIISDLDSLFQDLVPQLKRRESDDFFSQDSSTMNIYFPEEIPSS